MLLQSPPPSLPATHATAAIAVHKMPPPLHHCCSAHSAARNAWSAYSASRIQYRSSADARNFSAAVPLQSAAPPSTPLPPPTTLGAAAPFPVPYCSCAKTPAAAQAAGSASATPPVSAPPAPRTPP